MVSVKTILIPYAFTVLFCISCRKDSSIIDYNTYHVIIIAGQSNTHYGSGYNSILDSPDSDIMQFGRKNENNFKVILATQPLDHHTKKDSSIDFSLTFAKLYKKQFLNSEEKILIVPAGKAGTSFKKKHWSKEEDLYDDLVRRVKFILNSLPRSELKVFLWHQGESDVTNSNYQKDLDTFITNIREDLNNDSLPFILGGMVPYWVEKDSINKKTQQIIKSTPNRLENVAYADPNVPFIIEKDSNEVNQIHYDAKGLRELGKRYYMQYLKIK